MKQSFAILIILCCSMAVMAVPARKGVRILRQPDGGTIEAYKQGDEVCHFYTDREGYELRRDADGRWQRMELLTDERVRLRRAASPRTHRPTASRSPQASFATKGLVILTQFKDVKFGLHNTKQAFDSLLNGSSYVYNSATGSVKQYYEAQSAGMFSPTFVLYGPVTLKDSMRVYGGNDANGYDVGVGLMVKEACELVHATYGIDLSEFDADGDGYVDFVDVLYAGYGEADSDEENAVWPCEWELAASEVGSVLVLGEGSSQRTINHFSCHQELDGFGKQKGKRAGIGTACHEFGHVFGLPDFYDTNYKNATLGDWDVMDSGAYNNDGRTPPGFSGYERFFAGWLTPRVLTSEESVTLHELQTSREVLLVSETGVHNLNGTNPLPKTFYLLENRQKTGWDAYLPGHGLLLWKIQYNSSWWQQNTVNNRVVANQGVALMAADGAVYSVKRKGQIITYGDDGDTYPGAKLVTTCNMFDKYKATDIEETEGNISFLFSVSSTPTEVIASDELSFRSEKGAIIVSGIEQPAELTVFNALGQLVWHRTIAGGARVDLPTGVYVVRVGQMRKKVVVE